MTIYKSELQPADWLRQPLRLPQKQQPLHARARGASFPRHGGAAACGRVSQRTDSLRAAWRTRALSETRERPSAAEEEVIVAAALTAPPPRHPRHPRAPRPRLIRRVMLQRGKVSTGARVGATTGRRRRRGGTTGRRRRQGGPREEPAPRPPPRDRLVEVLFHFLAQRMGRRRLVGARQRRRTPARGLWTPPAKVRVAAYGR